MAAAGPLVDANMPVEGPASLNPRAIALSILVVFQGLLMALLFLAW